MTHGMVCAPQPEAVEAGCEAAVVLDGRVPHAMLLEVLTEQAYGTMIRSH